jgi:RNA polymerase sigma factor (sigma-70 family)
MATAQIDTVIRHLRRAVLRQDAAGWTDGQLLASFIDQKDEAAFEALVRRHGPMVFGVCRRIVGNHHDAEDAFQATILVLARKAASVRPRERVANWLHGVALRTAMKAKAMTARRRGREKQVTEIPEPEVVQQDQWRDLQPLVDQELNGLPENYRLPILLCDLEGQTIKEAAQQLGWPQGTVAGRLDRGRKLLAKRLGSRGVVLSAGALAAVVSQNVASAGVPTSLMSSTVKAATMIAAGQATFAGVVPAKVAALTEGVMKSMMLTKLSKAVAGLVVLGVVVFGGGLLTHRTAAGQQAKSEQDGDKPAIGQSTPPLKTPKTDLDRLQGVWSVVSEQQGGGQPSKLDNVVFFMVDRKRACWQTSDSEMQGGVYLEPTSKTYDFVTSTRTIEGIYSLDGDTLRLCWDKGFESNRPSGFITEKGSQQVLFVLKRIHGPEVFPYRLADGTRAFPRIIEKAMTIPPPQLAPTPKDSRPTPYNEKPDQKPKSGSAPAQSD